MRGPNYYTGTEEKVKKHLGKIRDFFAKIRRVFRENPPYSGHFRSRLTPSAMRRTSSRVFMETICSL